MDNFKKHIKEKYEFEFNSGDPELAWTKFEKKHLPEDRKSFMIWPYLTAGILVIGLLFSFFYFSTSNENNSIQVDEKTVHLQNKEINNDLRNTSHSKQMNGIDKVNNETKVSVDINNSNESVEIKSKKSIQQPYQIRSSQVKKTVKKIASKNIESKIPSLENKINQQKNNVARSNDKPTIKENRINSNDVDINSIPDFKKLDFLATLHLTELINFSDKKLLSVKKNYGKKKLKLFLGLSASANNLQHRFINNGQGYNIGLIGGAYLNDRISIRTDINFGQRKFNTFYNSKDLRISSVQLRSMTVSTENIEKEYKQLDLSLSIFYTLIRTDRYFLDIACGLVNKWDLNQVNNYNMNDGEIMYTESINTSKDFRYPLFYEYSIGLGTRFLNGSKLILRPYYSSQIRKIESMQPNEMGIQAEYIYQF